jgi:hypothetical protein
MSNKGELVSPRFTVKVTKPDMTNVTYTTHLLCPESGQNAVNVTGSHILGNGDKITITVKVVVDP